MTIKQTTTSPIHKQTNTVLIGSIIFILMGLMNLSFRLVPFGSLNYRIIGYVQLSITSIALIIIGFGLKEVTDVYFVDHITKAGQQTSKWIYFFSGAILLDMVTLGFPLFAGFVGLAIIFGRVMVYIKINKLFEKIKRIFDINIGSVLYILFGYYAIIVMVLGATANYASDVDFQIYLAVFNGIIESLLMVSVGIKLIIDIFRIKGFIEQEDIKPYSKKKAFLTRDRTDKPTLSTTKEHVQSKTQIARMQERTRTPVRKEKSKVSKTTKIVTTFIHCSHCSERTDKNLEFCMNCGEKLTEENKAEVTKPTEISVKRTLSPKREKILQQITIAIFLIAFVTYAFVIGDFSLIVYAWVIIAIFVTYLLVNYIVLFFSGRGFAIFTVLSDFAFLFIIIPILSAIFSYFVVVIIDEFSELTLIASRWITIAMSIGISLLGITLLLQHRVKSTGLSLREYIRYRFDFKARAEELDKSKERVEKKRANFDKLDRIEAHMKRQRKENVMDYEDFDLKQRLKDLGSPLSNDEEEE